MSRTPGFRGSFASLAWRNGELFASALIVDRMALLRLDKAGSAQEGRILSHFMSPPYLTIYVLK